MTISVRLDEELERDLESVALSTGLSKSAIVKQSLKEYLAKQIPQPTAYELGKDLFGKYGSGKGDLAERHSEHLKEIIRAKNRPKHPR